MTSDPVYELRIEDKKYNLNEGAHMIYSNLDQQNNRLKRRCKEKSPNLILEIETPQEYVKKSRKTELHAILNVSSKDLIIIALNSSHKIQINSEILEPTSGKIINIDDEVCIGYKTLTFNLKRKNSINTVHNDTSNLAFWNSTSSSPPLLSQNSIRIPNNDIYDAPTQNFAEPDIHEIVTQNCDIYDAATQQFPTETVPQPVENTAREEIIDFDELTEDPVANYDMEGSQNLLEDYEPNNSPEISNPRNVTIADDDCSTDMEDPYDVPTQILPSNDDIIKKELHSSSNNENLDNIFDMPIQIIDELPETQLFDRNSDNTSPNAIDELPPTMLLPQTYKISDQNNLETYEELNKENLNLSSTSLSQKLAVCLNHSAVDKSIEENEAPYYNLTQDVIDDLCFTQKSVNSVINPKEKLCLEKLSVLNHSAVDKPIEENKVPYYNLTQDVIDDLCFTQKSTNSIINPEEKVCLEKPAAIKNSALDTYFATPFSKVPKKIEIDPNVSRICETPQNYYNSTQELLSDLLTQKKPEKPSVSQKNKPSKLIFDDLENMQELNINMNCQKNDSSEDEDEIIPCSQIDPNRYRSSNTQSKEANEPSTSASKNNDHNDQISPFKLYNSESFESMDMSTPIKNPSNNIFQMELPDSQEIRRHVSRYQQITIPESPSGSETGEDSDSSNAPIVFKRQIPNKTKKPAKKTISPKKRTSNRIQTRKNVSNVQNDLADPEAPVQKKITAVKIMKSKVKLSEKIEKDSKKSKSNNNQDIANASKDNCNKINMRKRNSDDRSVPILNKKIRVPSLSEKDVISSYTVMFTQINDEKLFKAVNELGGTKVNIGGRILVATQITRTFKTLMAISQRLPIVTPQWLTDSIKWHRFLDPEDYLIDDKEFEKRHKFKLKTAFDAKRNFLTGWTAYVTPSVMPPPIEIKQLVESNGGTCIICETLRKCRNIKQAEKTFTITCTNDRGFFKYLPNPHVVVEALLGGILRQKLDLDPYTCI